MARPTGIAEESPTLRTATADDKPSGRGMRIVNWHDDCLGLAKMGKENLRKVFPDHWSFLLGEIALYSFVALLLTGVFLTCLLYTSPSPRD